ncbi:MAG: hypothetical protein DRQ24_05905 [Candidatus Latescibacterota bacterium]|nr:MAG: hypothetical protein DRQ24_05905 [Candidatus Latescibacterota bacterium]
MFTRAVRVPPFVRDSFKMTKVAEDKQTQVGRNSHERLSVPNAGQSLSMLKAGNDGRIKRAFPGELRA